MTDSPIHSGVEGEAPALGQKVTERGGSLDTIDAPKTHRITRYISDEVTANCPVTGQPDWYQVEISIKLAEKLIESKSLKLYLQSFRDSGMFAEDFAARIAQDVKDAIGAGHVDARVIQKPRGGVSIVTESYGEERE